jgi:CheY-like chemotaxis protein
MTRPADFSEEEIEAAMADSYVSLPITDHASLAAAVNKALEHRYGVADD